MEWINILNTQIERQRPFVMATIVEKVGGSPREPGTRFFITRDGTLGTIGGGELEERVKKDGMMCLEKTEGLLKSYNLREGCAGRVTVFFEYMAPVNHLIIFGGGHVGRALSRVMAQTSFKISVVEEREEFSREENFPQGVRILKRDYIKAARELATGADNTFVVSLTYSHEKDESVIAELINKPCRYLGVIGSSKKAAALKAKLKQKGVGDEVIKHIRCPVGLRSIKGRMPKEIAISIAAEILSMAG